MRDAADPQLMRWLTKLWNEDFPYEKLLILAASGFSAMETVGYGEQAEKMFQGAVEVNRAEKVALGVRDQE